ncbi:MAG: DUF389 domain-containing protein [Bacteroidales bacterium]|nr:DUF389 domain-containing protein [Bacteroidales bacterium]MBP5382249.1 DUF389 domain-containing protein [Bacteroidales bacterium]MBP5521096.1 DUF389 domain-containing protein [Bacteroidales bacterium]
MNSHLKRFFLSLVSLSNYVDLDGANASIRKNIYFRGPNVFILACAIIIASVGLNVNSIPVIIGAMLISPVMGPILGFGFSLGVQDFHLLRDSLRNYAIMVIISIMASALYYLLSPLNMEHPTELLARTNPTIYDVLIALFGGFAGILEISRSEKGTVLSGVAIATALMPPLCTVGYGLSILNWSYVLGAFYLFLINSIFIALATFVMVKYLKFPVLKDSQDTRKRLPGWALALILVIIIVPSVFSAVRMVKESNLRRYAAELVSSNKTLGRGFIYDYKVDMSSSPAKIELFMAGEKMGESDKEKLYSEAERYGITRSQIVFREDAVTVREDDSQKELIQSILDHSDRRQEKMNADIKALQDSIAVLNRQLEQYRKAATEQHPE